VLQCVAVCGSVWQCVAVCCIRSAVDCRARLNYALAASLGLYNAYQYPVQCAAVCSSVMQCVALCCSELQCGVVGCRILQYVAASYSDLQWVSECV